MSKMVGLDHERKNTQINTNNIAIHFTLLGFYFFEIQNFNSKLQKPFHSQFRPTKKQFRIVSEFREAVNNKKKKPFTLWI